MTNRTYIDLNNQVPGYVYLMHVVDCHATLSGSLKRVKIGLSPNPEEHRREIIRRSEPPPNIQTIATAYVRKAKTVKDLHEKFKHCRVEDLEEYFDLDPTQYEQCLKIFRDLSQPRKTASGLLFVILIIAGIVAVAASPIIQRPQEVQQPREQQPQEELQIIPQPQR